MEHYHYSENDSKNDLDNINDGFIANRDLFINTLGTLFVNRNDSYYINVLQYIDCSSYPNDIIAENGCIILNYQNDSVQKENIYIYIDKKNSLFCGYTLQ